MFRYADTAHDYAAYRDQPKDNKVYMLRHQVALGIGGDFAS